MCFVLCALALFEADGLSPSVLALVALHLFGDSTVWVLALIDHMVPDLEDTPCRTVIGLDLHRLEPREGPLEAQ